MKKVKVGIVGLGELGSVHASNLRFKIPNAELIAICGLPVEKEKLETIQSDWEIPYCFYDFEEMVNLPELEAVVISSSTAAHYDGVLSIEHEDYTMDTLAALGKTALLLQDCMV